MMQYIIVCALCWICAVTIFYFAIRIEEFIMKKLTGEGIIMALCRIIKEFKSK